MKRSKTVERWPFGLTGVLAAAAGMAAGHLTAAIVLADASPVLAVGANVIEATPVDLEQWAIRRFGSNDKTVLVGSVVAVTAILAIVAGISSRRRPRVGVGFVVLLGMVVIAAAHRSAAVQASGAGLARTALPGLVAMVAAISVLLGLRRLALVTSDTVGDPPLEPFATLASSAARPASDSAPDGEKPDETDPIDGSAEGTDVDKVESPLDHVAFGYRVGLTPRRRFLLGAAGVLGASTAAVSVGQRLLRPGTVGSIEDLRIDDRAPAFPASFDRRVPGITPLRTPTAEFYRVDTALVIPRIDRSSWKLTILGDVESPLELTFDDLVREFPLIERDITLTCVSNDVGGSYVSAGRWIGVRTRDLFRRARPTGRADQILSRSSDGMTISTPIGALTDDRDAMVAIGLNGEALPRERGYPARLITPGLYGFVGATKWLVELRATTYRDERAYWTKRKWAIDAPVRTQSRIDTPAGFEKVPAGVVRIGGVAWAQRRGIDAVEVRVDDGPWRPATLGPEVNVDYWRQWYLDVDIREPGRHDLQVRATDGHGHVQESMRRTPFPSGASGHQTVSIEVI